MVRSWLVPGDQVGRLRLLMLFLVQIVGIVSLVDVRWLGEPARNPPLVVIAVVGLLAWAVIRYRRPDLWTIVDVVPLGAVFVLGLSASTPEAAFGSAFALLCFRAQFGGWTAALGSGVAYAVAFLAPYVVLRSEEASRPVAALLLLSCFVVIAAIMHGIMLAAHRQQLSLRRERLLSEASAELLTAASEDDLLEQALGAISALGAGVLGVQLLSPKGSARESSVRSGTQLLSPTVGSARLRLDRLPDPGSSGLERGEALQLDVDAYHQAGLVAPGDDPSRVRGLLIPLRVRDQLEGIVAIAIGGSEALDELATVVSRFVGEVGLAVGHLRLTGELTRSNAVKEQFLSMLSHELRAPLTVIGGVLDTLRERSGSLSASATDELLAVGQRHVERQQRLIEDALLTVRTEGHEPPVVPSWVDVPSFVVQLLDDLGLDELTTVTSGPGEQVAWVDELHLSQMLSNLLINARKYGSPPLEVSILRRDAQLVVEVHDHGRGIPEYLMPRLFEPFEQATEGRSAADGVGLGLAISRQLAHANGGELDVLEEQSQGACFRLALPAGSEETGHEVSGAGQVGLAGDLQSSGAGEQHAV